MNDDAPSPSRSPASATETLEAAAARLQPALRMQANLYRVVEVMRAPNGRLARVGQIWHTDLAHVRRFGRALAGNTVGDQVQVADASGAVIETIPAAAAGAGPAGWGDWKALPLPPAPPRRAPVRAAPPPAPRPPPTMVPPILPQALPASLAPSAARPPADEPMIPPENEVERTNPLPPSGA